MNTHFLTALSFSADIFLRWYALACLVLIPLALMYLILVSPSLRRHMRALRRLRRMVADNLQETKTKKETPPTQTQPQMEQEYGVAKITLYVGDEYSCRLTAADANDFKDQDPIWSSTNTFVAQVNDENGHLWAHKAGETNIEYGQDNIRIYHLTVLPSNQGWRHAELLCDIIRHTPKEKIITDGQWEKEPLRASREDAQEKVICFFDQEGYLRGMALRILISDDGKEIHEYLNDYIEQVGQPEDDMRYFLRLYGAEESEHAGSVALIALTCKTASGVLWFCAARCWREGATIQEVQENRMMIRRSLVEFIDKDERPAEKRQKREDSPNNEGNTSKPAKVLYEDEDMPEENYMDENQEDGTQQGDERDIDALQQFQQEEEQNNNWFI